MVSILKFFGHSQFFLETGRLLLLSIGAGYVSANVRRLSAKYRWDRHFLALWNLLAVLIRERDDGSSG